MGTGTRFFSLAAYAADLQQKDIEVYGQNIHYADTGSGPTIILLHGLWGGLNEWAPIIDPLSENHRIIVMDFIGFHGSDKPDTQYHNALLSQFLAGFIETLALENVTLIGHAMVANSATNTRTGESPEAANRQGLLILAHGHYSMMTMKPDRRVLNPDEKLEDMSQ